MFPFSRPIRTQQEQTRWRQVRLMGRVLFSTVSTAISLLGQLLLVFLLTWKNNHLVTPWGLSAFLLFTSAVAFAWAYLVLWRVNESRCRAGLFGSVQA